MFLAAVVKAHLPPLPEGAESRVPDDSETSELDTRDSEARAAVKPADNPVPARARWL